VIFVKKKKNFQHHGELRYRNIIVHKDGVYTPEEYEPLPMDIVSFPLRRSILKKN